MQIDSSNLFRRNCAAFLPAVSGSWGRVWKGKPCCPFLVCGGLEPITKGAPNQCEALMTFAMGNCITLEDTNGNRKLLKKRREQKIDAVAAMMDAYVAYKANKDAFE